MNLEKVKIEIELYPFGKYHHSSPRQVFKAWVDECLFEYGYLNVTDSSGFALDLSEVGIHRTDDGGLCTADLKNLKVKGTHDRAEGILNITATFEVELQEME